MSDHHDHHIPNPNHPEEVGDDEDDMSEEFDEEIEISPTTNLSSLFQFALLTAAHSSNITGNPLFHSLQSSPSSAGGSNSPSRLTDFQTLDRSRVLYSNLVKQYFYQLVYGCGNPQCRNQFCRSNPENRPRDRTAAANIALALAKRGPIYLCGAEEMGLEAGDMGAEGSNNDREHGKDPGSNVHLTLALLKEKVAEYKADQNAQKLATFIYQVFSKPDNLCHSFLKDQKKNLQGVEAIRECPLDLNQVREAYSILVACPEVVQKAVLTGSENTLNMFKSIESQINMISPLHLTSLLILLENPLFMDPTLSHASILPKLCDILARVATMDDDESDADMPLLSDKKNNGKALLVGWLTQSYETSHFSKLVAVIQQFITMRLLTGFNSSPNKDEAVMQATKGLRLLYEANEQKEYVHYTEFYNDAVNEQMEIKEDFPHWKAKEGFSFCNFSYILTAATKTDILKVESMVQMRHELQDAFFRAMFAGVQSPYLVLEIRRDYIIRDALYQLDNKTQQDLKKQLRVQFLGEEGVDEGGVQKEFFQLVIREMFDPKYGMFQVKDDSQLVWFTPNPEDDELALDEYRLVGRLIGLAIYNSVILDVHFPLALYKKLMGKPVNLSDLRQLDPSMGQGLDQLLKFSEGDVKEFYDRTFQIEYEVFGTKHTHDLKENGASIELDNSNRKEFVDLYLDFVFNKSVYRQFNSFKEGFDSVCAGSAIQLFRPEELELLVCGSCDLDFEALEKVTIYDGGFTKESPIIKIFWEVVHGFSQEEKKRLLFFTTGTDRVPIGGLSKLNFVIAKNGQDSDRLPTSHTCFNVLLLPDYASKEKLKERILTAIQNAEGFGLI